MGNEEVLSLDLGAIEKRKIWVNSDQSRVIELNLSDMGIVDRFITANKNLQKLADEVTSLSEIVVNEDDNNEEALEQVTTKLKELDRKMRDEIDFLFDSKVSDVCVPTGTMYDPHGGKFTFEHVIEGLIDLYTDSIQDEFSKVQKNVAKHTAKYTNKKK